MLKVKQAIMQILPWLLLTVSMVSGDVYFHSPRGSNDRLNETSAARTNGNRLFDSQNNARGGYNVGDKTAAASGNNEENQYRMTYFQSGPNHKTLSDGRGASQLTLEWTNQHGCGGDEDSDPHKQNCNIVFQYMCQEDTNTATGTAADKHVTLRNGVQTATQEYTPPATLTEAKVAANQRRNKVSLQSGLHEGWEWYDKCYIRERNQGLFIADRGLKSNKFSYSSAIYTRQNNNGARRGYECPEERDHYPYWHPSPWKDIAVLAENSSFCSHYTSKSFNTQPYHECIEYWDGAKTSRKHYSRWNNKAQCSENGGTWTALYNFLEKAPQYTSQQTCTKATTTKIKYIWEVPYDSADSRTKECLVALDTPHCEKAPWTRSNHLGDGRHGAPNNLTWTLPYFPSGKVQRCVLRVRYNVSTDDYDPHYTDHTYNQNRGAGKYSPIQNDPYVHIGSDISPLRLALNTAQTGRVFQDRTHVFLLKPRPSGLENDRIFNLNVRGKRGTVVQTYPGVQYDFFPRRLNMGSQDLVHIQWTGSNTHNNGAPAGDGAINSNGQGKAGSDRHNLVQIGHLNENYPLPYEMSTMWTNAEVKWIYHAKQDISAEDLAINMASSGYFKCKKQSNCPGVTDVPETKAAMQPQLDNAPASYEGALLKFKPGTYHFMCTRNNEYSERSQKGTIFVN